MKFMLLLDHSFQIREMLSGTATFPLKGHHSSFRVSCTVLWKGALARLCINGNGTFRTKLVLKHSQVRVLN